MSKKYKAKLDTNVTGVPLRAGEEISLTEEQAKPYIDAGLLDDAEGEAPAKKSQGKK